MLIPCPHCGPRSLEEFTYLGDASVVRPRALDTQVETWSDYVYLRDNRKGRMSEYWHHVGGCRAWFVVDRDTLSHEIFGSQAAAAWPATLDRPSVEKGE